MISRAFAERFLAPDRYFLGRPVALSFGTRRCLRAITSSFSWAFSYPWASEVSSSRDSQASLSLLCSFLFSGFLLCRRLRRTRRRARWCSFFALHRELILTWKRCHWDTVGEVAPRLALIHPHSQIFGLHSLGHTFEPAD